MLDPGSAAVTATTHTLAHTLWESLYVEAEEWQSSPLPHICLFRFPLHPHVILAAPLPLLLHTSWVSRLLPAYQSKWSSHTHGSVLVWIVWTAAVQFQRVIKAGCYMQGS